MRDVLLASIIVHLFMSNVMNHDTTLGAMALHNALMSRHAVCAWDRRTRLTCIVTAKLSMLLYAAHVDVLVKDLAGMLVQCCAA
mmetsp:Transcript_5117/g.8568  ORF Transcript_5117/g.8568 Transcript_5117/m.8568 type:complete len:84 (-) Transcript_5117:290-541(-)